MPPVPLFVAPHSRHPDRKGYRCTVEDSICVRPDCIGYGVGRSLVGRSLLTELIAACQALQCHSMVACICGINVASTALHTSLGFDTVGVLPEARKKQRMAPPLHMQLSLV